jgi:hypothetical protein
MIFNRMIKTFLQSRSIRPDCSEATSENYDRSPAFPPDTPSDRGKAEPRRTGDGNENDAGIKNARNPERIPTPLSFGAILFPKILRFYGSDKVSRFSAQRIPSTAAEMIPPA